MELIEMAFDRKEIMSEAKGQFYPILIHWILVRYASKYLQGSELLEHWQKELVAALWNVGMMRHTKNDSRSFFKKALDEMYFTKMQVQNMNYIPIINRICKKEHITLDSGEYASAFKEAMTDIVSVMASGDYDVVWDYVDKLGGTLEN